MRRFAWIAALILSWPSAGRAAEELPVPSNLTLTVKAPGKLSLLWDPIFEDDLLGYSVWMRRAGEAEFTRLAVPQRAGGSTVKLDIIRDAHLDIKVGAGKALELAVLALYERGESQRSATVLTSLAALPEGGLSSLTPTSASLTKGKAAVTSGEPLRQRILEDKAGTSDAQEARFGGKTPRKGADLITPAGKFRSRLGVEFEVKRVLYTGREAFRNLRLVGTDIPGDKVVDWNLVYMRSVFVVPLTLSYGLFQGLELWGQATYHAEDASIDDYVIDSRNFSYIRFIGYREDGSIFYLPDPSSATWGDSKVGFKLQPAARAGVVLSLESSIPTGRSRFKSYIDWSDARTFEAGTGEGVARPALQLDLGKRGIDAGPSVRLRYRPAATERVVNSYFGYRYEHVATLGEEAELGFAYTLPWTSFQFDGTLALGLHGRSVGASKWTVNAFDYLPFFHVTHAAWFTNHSGMKNYRDDQLNAFAEIVQAVPGGLEIGGRLGYTWAVHGDALQIEGTFYY